MTTLLHNLMNGRYRVERLLGHGGMGSVYAAIDERLGRPVAVKMLRSDLAADPRSHARFVQEAQIAAQCRHHHIVRTFDVGETPDGPFLVQELLDGQSLDTRLPLEPLVAVRIAEQLADALGYIHERGYVHCDIKPHNIMWVTDDDGTERVVLLDFGIARAQGTETTTLIATPEYLAPERMAGGAPTPSSDLYALGILLYALIAGDPPFRGSNIHAVIEAHRTTPVPPFPAAIPHHQALNQIIGRLCAKAPEGRYASAADVRHDLLALLTHDPHAQTTLVVAPQRPVVRPTASPPLPPPISAAAGRTSRWRGWYVAIPALLVVLLVGIALRGWTRGNTSAAETTNRSSPAAHTSAAPVPAVQAPAADASVPSADVTVPDVVGLPSDVAQQQLTAVGLTVVAGASMVSEQPVGTVLTTVPAAGETVATGTQVLVDMSLGLPAVVPPAPPSEDTQGSGNNQLSEEQKKAEEKQREEQKKVEEKQREEQKKVEEKKD